MSDHCVHSDWRDEDVPVPLHQPPQQDCAETPVVLEISEPPAKVTLGSGGDGAAAEGARDAGIEPADVEAASAPPPPAEFEPEPAFGGLVSPRPLPRWLYGIAALLLAALCGLSFALGWQQGTLEAAEAISPDAGSAVMSDTYPQRTIG